MCLSIFTPEECLLEVLPKPSRNIVLQFAVGEVPENSLHLFENADVVLLARLLQVPFVEICFSLNTTLLHKNHELIPSLPQLRCSIYLSFDAFFSAEVLVDVSGGALGSQKANTDVLHHVELLQHGVHVASSTCIFQSHKTMSRSRAHGGHEVPLSQRFLSL